MEEYLSPLARPFSFPEGDHGVLLIHGFTGSASHMRLIGEEMHRRGFAVKGILLPGHGESPEKMAKATWQDWVRAAREAAREMREKYPHFSAAGLSMGGCLSLMLAEEMNLTACVPIAAPMKTINRFRSLAPAMAPLYPMMHKKPDGTRRLLDARYDFGYQSFPTVSTHHLSVIIRRARQHLSLIQCPILVVQSKKDRVVTPDSPQIILDGVSSKEKAQLWLEDAPHTCTIAPEYPAIVDAMEACLRKWEKKS